MSSVSLTPTKFFPHAFNAHAQPPVWDWISYRAEHAESLDVLRSGGAPADIVIGLQSAYTVDFLQQVIEAKLLYCGRRPRVLAGGFNQFRQELLDPNSAHYAARPRATVLLLDPREDIAIQDIEAIVRAHTAVLPESILIVSNFVTVHLLSPQRGERNEVRGDCSARNSALRDLAASHPQVRVLDMNQWAAQWGWHRVVDPKHEFLAGMLIAPEMVPFLAEEILAFLYESLGLRKKCLVLDLDETLWGGIVGEEGMGGIALDVQPPGNVYRAIQETALALRSKGVLLAVASKNNPADALEVIDKHPHMVLRREHFADLQIGWQPKDEMLRAIAKNLNIGVDSLVFLDDSAVERDLVRRLLPAVTVLDAPPDPAWWPRYLAGLRCFEASTLTAEDKSRAKMYEEEKKRKEAQESSGSLEDYLKSLDTVVTLGALSAEADPNLPRVAQLSHRTNQFNLTTRRYTEGDLSAIVRDGGAVYWMKVSDRLGDSGLVGVAIIPPSSRGGARGGEPRIDNFFMSCRVIGRGVERAFLREILLRLKSAGAARVSAEYVASEKNMQTKDFYKTSGFEAVRNSETAARYELALDRFNPLPVPYVRVVWAT